MPESPRPAARSAAAAAPKPLAPIDGAVAPLDAVTFRWSAPPGPKAFDLRIATAADPDATLVELEGLPTTETTLADALPPEPCLWWVRRSDGPWSAPSRFVAGTAADLEVAAREAAARADEERKAELAAKRQPRVLEPLPEVPPEPVWPHAAGDALDGAPALDWSSVPGFGPPERADLPAVEAEPPRPLGPLGGEVVDAVTVALRWAGVPGATGYEVELSPHPAFDRDVLTLDAGRTTEVALPGLVPSTGHKLLWRVRARVGDGATRWSKYGRFYPAADAPVEAFRTGMDAAVLAERKRREHARLVREHEISLVPLHEREDAVTDGATLAVLVGMMLSGIVIALIVLVVSLIPT